MPRMINDSGETEKVQARYVEVADGVIEASDNFPFNAVRVVMETETGNEVTMSVPIHKSATNKLDGFVPQGLTAPDTESDLKRFIRENFIRDKVWVNVVKGWVTERLAPPGTHIFKLHDIRKARTPSEKWGYFNCWFTVRTKDGMKASFPAPYRVNTRIGDTPDDDGVGIKDSTKMYAYLEMLGMDFERFEEDIMTSPALWPEHDMEGAMFTNSENICPQLVQAIAEHGPAEVQMQIIIDDTYGLSPKTHQSGNMTLVNMARVVTVDKAIDEAEVLTLEAMWDSLTKVVMGGTKDFYTAGGLPTEDGAFIVRNVMLPVIHEYPWIVTAEKEDGTPAINFPITDGDWSANGLICLNILATKLLTADAAGEIELSNPAGIVDKNDHSKLLAWVKENVPELTEYKKEQTF